MHLFHKLLDPLFNILAKGSSGPSNLIITEGGDFIITENGNYMITE